MKLWQRAAGAIKDRNSLWLASMTRRSSLRNPDMEAAVIKATSHDQTRIDYANAQRVFAWIRVSDSYLRPLLWAISVRMERTHSWVVALKGLILLHGIFCCKVPAVQRIGRLPFDLSNFKDGHSSPGKTWAHNAFVRAYYAYLDHKSTFIFLHSQEKKEQRKKDMAILSKGGESVNSMMQELVWLQKLQNLLDKLLQIRPQGDVIMGALFLEAMDCLVIEVFDVYSRICNGIAQVLMRIYSAGKAEATLLLTILQKSTVQGEELELYFEFCRDIGVINAAECPKVEHIPEEDIRELESIIHGVSEKSETTNSIAEDEKEEKELSEKEKEEKAIVVREERPIEEWKDTSSNLKTIITKNWEVFEEDHQQMAKKNKYDDFPDLISF